MTKITGLSEQHIDHIIKQFDAVMDKATSQTFALAAHNLTFASKPSMVAAVSNPNETEFPEEPAHQFVSDTALSVIQHEWLSHVTNEVLPFLGKVYLQGAMAIAVNVKENVSTAANGQLPEVSAEGAQLFLAAASNRVKAFSSRMWEVAKQELTDGVSKGQSIEKIAQRVATATAITHKKAAVISQTEVIAAVNAGEFAQMRQMASAFDFVTEKEWVSTHDSHTRPTHHEANGQKVPLNERFHVGQSFLDFPGDPTGPASEIISCRCTVVFEVTDTLTASDHWKTQPRNPANGEWTEDGSDISSKIGSLISGKNLVDVDWDNELKNTKSSNLVFGATDDNFVAIAHRQGFDGKPQVASKKEVDDIVANGGTDIFRGTQKKYADQYVHGDYFVGFGAYGNGTYASTDKSLADQYADGHGKENLTVVRMALRSDARTISVKALEKEMDAQDNLSEVLKTDNGRYAAAAGYDAFFRKQADGSVVWVIVNRTAVVVEGDSTQNHNPQSSPGALSAAGLVDTKEQFSTAFNDFHPVDHPRGPDGKFIGSGHVVDVSHLLKAFSKRFGKAKTGEKVYKNVASSDAFTPDKNGNWTDDTIDGIHNAVGTYQIDAFAINSGLRQGIEAQWKPSSDGFSNGFQQTIKAFDSAMAKKRSALKDDIVVERGIQDPHLVWGDAWSDNGSNVGLTWEDHGYTSTTTDSGVAQHFTTKEHEGHITGAPIAMRILVPKGTPALKIGENGSRPDYQWEREVLLPRNAQFRIMSDNGVDADGIHRIDVELVSHGAGLIAAADSNTVKTDPKSITPATMKQTVPFIDAGPLVKIVRKTLVAALTHEEALVDLQAIVASNFNPVEHPRGKDGKFIKGGFLPNGVLGALKISSVDELSTSGQHSIADGLNDLNEHHWAKLTDGQKQHLTQLNEQLMDANTPGSYKAATHLEYLETDLINKNDDVDLFNPDNALLLSSKTPTTDHVNQSSFTKELWDQFDPKVQALFKKTVADEATATQDPDTFTAFKKILDFEEATQVQTPRVDILDTPLPTSDEQELVDQINHPDFTKATWDALSLGAKQTMLDDIGYYSAELDIPGAKEAVWKIKGFKDPGGVATSTSSIQKATPVKITHALIHAKHGVGEVVAQTSGGNARIKWNGKEYEIQKKHHGGGPWATQFTAKKSAAYAALASGFPNAQWVKPGKQDNENSAPNLAATKSDLNPIPAPLAKKSSSIDGFIAPNELKIHQQYMKGLMTLEEHDQLLAELNGEETAPQTINIPVFMGDKKNLTGWKKVGQNPGGFHTGGFYEDESEQKWYVKTGASEDSLKSELLANKLYALAGTNVPELHLAEGAPGLPSGTLLASKVVPNAKMDPTALKTSPVFKAKIQADFATHAWLANWDAVGSGDTKYSNIMNADDTPWMIDAGGALMYKGTGQKKPGGLPNTVIELESLLDPKFNKETSTVFGGMSFGAQRESAKRLLPVTDENIAQAINDSGIEGIEAVQLLKILKDRRKFILEKYDLLKNDKSGAKDFGIPATSVDPSKIGPSNNVIDTYWLESPTVSSYQKQKTAISFALKTSVDTWNQLTVDQQMMITDLIDDAADSGIDGAEDAQASLLDFANVDPADVTLIDVPSAPIKTSVEQMSFAAKAKFYDTFKAEKVSPAWSGAKIYASIQAAKEKHQDNPQIANANDGVLLQIVDEQLNILGKNKSTSKTPYADKVIEWLQTPNGKKAAQAAKLNAPTSGIKITQMTEVHQPSISIPTGSKAPVPIPGAPEVAQSILNDTGTSLTGHDEAEQLTIFNDFRSVGNAGGYFSSSPDDLFKNVQKISEKYGLPAATVVKIVDVQGAKKANIANADVHLEKLRSYLSDQKNLLNATHIVPIDVESKLLHNAPSAKTVVNLGPQPHGTKAEILAKNSSDFTVKSTTWASQTFGKLTAGQLLKASQKGALKMYTGSSYTSMNNALRQKTTVNPGMLKTLNNAQAGMRPIPEDVLVHRGTGWSQFGGIKNAAEAKQLVGKTLQDKGFMSTSVGGSASFVGAVTMEIEVPKGTGAMYVAMFSHHKSENELLLSAGLRYRVLNVADNGYGVTVRVRIIPPPDGSVS